MSLLDLPSVAKQVELIWHGANQPENLKIFLASSILWGEVDVRAENEQLVCRHDSFEERALEAGEVFLIFENCLQQLLAMKKKVKLDVKEGGPTLKKLKEVLKSHQIEGQDLIFNTNMLYVSLEEMGEIHQDFPQSVLQNPIPLSWMRQEMPLEQEEMFYKHLKNYGVTGISLNWEEKPTREEAERIFQKNFTLNLYNVETLADFESALLFKPNMITSDFNIPEWNLAGQGSGEKKTANLKGLDKHFQKD